MEPNYVIEGLFVILGVALIATIVKYPKETIIKLPFGIFYYVVARPIVRILLLPMWIIGFPIVYFGEKFKWKIAPKALRFLNRISRIC